MDPDYQRARANYFSAVLGGGGDYEQACSDFHSGILTPIPIQSSDAYGQARQIVGQAQAANFMDQMRAALADSDGVQ